MFKIINNKLVLYTMIDTFDGVEHIYDAVVLTDKQAFYLLSSITSMISIKDKLDIKQKAAFICDPLEVSNEPQNLGYVELNSKQIDSYIEAVPHIVKYMRC